jgi:hypothetical protein
MPRLTPTLYAVALALVLAPASASAEEVMTSRGARTLPRVEILKGEAQLTRAEHGLEETVWQLLQDIDAIEKSRTGVSGDAVALAEKVKRDAAELTRVKAEFEQADKKYRDDLAAFEQGKVALEAEVERQRADAAVLEAIPSAQRDYAQVVRMNTWAQELAARRDRLDAERNRLLAEHDRVEAERQRVAGLFTAAQQRAQGARDGTIGQFNSVEQKRIAVYQELRKAVRRHQQVREMLAAAVAPRAIGHSSILTQAEQRLQAFDSHKAQ